MWMEILMGGGCMFCPSIHRSSPHPLFLCGCVCDHELFTVKRKAYAFQISTGCHSFNTLQNTTQFNKTQWILTWYTYLSLISYEKINLNILVVTLFWGIIFSLSPPSSSPLPYLFELLGMVEPESDFRFYVIIAFRASDGHKYVSGSFESGQGSAGTMEPFQKM